MLILLSLLSLFLSPSNRPVSAGKINLRVDIQNVRLVQGTVYIALFSPGKDFPEGKPVEQKKLYVGSKILHTTFSVEPGNYAIALYHDENDNGKMDTRMFGIPKEPYGFSNNFKPVMSAPKFSDCQFSVGDGGKAISIKLI